MQKTYAAAFGFASLLAFVILLASRPAYAFPLVPQVQIGNVIVPLTNCAKLSLPKSISGIAGFVPELQIQVPEPATMLLLGFGLAALGYLRWR